jgi:hypothetical protein
VDSPFIGGLLKLGGGFIIAHADGDGLSHRGGRHRSFIVTFSSFSGFLGHMAEGRIDPWLAGVTVVMVILGSQLGAWFMAKKARPGWVKRLYGVVLLGVAAQLLHGLVSESE